jgi:hypothetical protein
MQSTVFPHVLQPFSIDQKQRAEVAIHVANIVFTDSVIFVAMLTRSKQGPFALRAFCLEDSVHNSQHCHQHDEEGGRWGFLRCRFGLFGLFR